MSDGGDRLASMTRVQIEAKPDYILRVAKIKDPVGGLAEIIWNALDAEATSVLADIELNEVDGVEKVIVADNGHGMPHPSCASYFGNLGGSWKATAQVSADLGRSLHGQSGQGRLRGFALGQRIRWTTVARVADGSSERTEITGESGRPTDFDISDPEVVPTATASGTVFEAWVPTDYVNRLTHPAARGRLTALFAPFLATHPDVEIVLDGVALDPAAAWIESVLFRLPWPAPEDESETVAVPLSEPIEATDEPLLRIIEWPQDVGRKLALCDAQGVELGTTAAGLHKPGVHFTAYLLWDGLREHVNVIALAEWEESEVAPLINLARATIKQHLAQRDRERRREQIDKWKSANVYPYEGAPTEPVQVVERQVFDEVATTIARKLPKAIAQQKVTLRLLREVLSHDPDGLVPVLDELFRLPKSERDELRRLLDRTTLSNIVKASGQVADRLDFLRALKLMVFEPEVAKKVKERSELHKILERETWVFGERFTMMLSDKSLDSVLQRHLTALGREDAEVTPVRRDDGRVGIVDLMLGAARRGTTGREHLVIELKAPIVKIGQKETSQIKSYASAVAADAQFRDARATWDFMIISTEMDDVTRRDASSQHLPHGCIASWENDVRVWAFTWSDIIEECERRMHYYREMLNHDPELVHATEYLRREHPERTPAALTSVG